MAVRSWFAVLLVALVVLAATSCTRPSGESSQAASGVSAGEPAPPQLERSEPFFLRFYAPPELEIEAKIAPYKLPLKPEEIANWAEASKHFRNEGTAQLILANGFAVEEDWGEQLGEIDTAYRNLPSGVPVIVTADSVLHIQHVLYDQLFREIEEAFLVEDLRSMTTAALARFDAAYRAQERTAGGSTKAAVAVRRNAAYFAVAACLLDPATIPPDYVKTEVSRELDNIAAGSVARSAIFIYSIDYSQFAPRGHYTSSPELERYFQAMMWYAQCACLFQEGIVDAGTADIQLTQAIQIGGFLTADPRAYREWRRIHAAVGFFAGAMDDATIADVIGIKNALDAELAGAGEQPGEAAYLGLIRRRLLALPPPRIHAATGLPEREPITTPERKQQWLEQARGMRLFGQRFSLDGYAMSELTGFTYLGNGTPSTLTLGTRVLRRGYPSSLDVMTLLGSKRAEAVLREAGDAEYAYYDRELARLKTKFGRLTDDEWHANLANGRLELIRMLLEPLPEGYPTAMRTAAWTDRTLNTGLAAWAQLKHDMILAHKQPYAGFESVPAPSSDYAEPLPLLYAEVRAQNVAVRRGVRSLFPELINWKALGAKIVNALFQRDPFSPVVPVPELRDAPPYMWPLDQFDRWLERLTAISLKELRGEPLDEDDRLFFGSIEDDIAVIMSAADRETKHPAVVADVFTEPNEGRVLEVATGRLNLLWMVCRMPDGTKVLGAGPVMSYYEFKRPMEARLSDDDWRDMLGEGKAPDPPAWTKSFLTRKPVKSDN